MKQTVDEKHTHEYTGLLSTRKARSSLNINCQGCLTTIEAGDYYVVMTFRYYTPGYGRKNEKLRVCCLCAELLEDYLPSFNGFGAPYFRVRRYPILKKAKALGYSDVVSLYVAIKSGLHKKNS
jgi:hypothetical protein